jgi:hypothetical protein
MFDAFYSKGITLVLFNYILDGGDFSSLAIEILIMAVYNKQRK